MSDIDHVADLAVRADRGGFQDAAGHDAVGADPDAIADLDVAEMGIGDRCSVRFKFYREAGATDRAVGSDLAVPTDPDPAADKGAGANARPLADLGARLDPGVGMNRRRRVF